MGCSIPEPARVPGDRHWIGLIQQYISADYSIEGLLGRPKAQYVRVNEINVCAVALTENAISGAFENRLVPINSGYVFGNTYKLGSKQRNVAHSAAEIQYTHSMIQASRTKKSSGSAADYARL